MSETRKHVIIYTDGGCEPNPGAGGYFEYYLYCPGCSRMFMVEEAKRNIDRPSLFE
ncbi:MAG: hypothetical protein KDE24_28890 [Caldilinea sp.]|nr:hypothetical protein [Caldilinea sp.]HRW46104.1 hypothetical protein [Caldilinea sp.]